MAWPTRSVWDRETEGSNPSFPKKSMQRRSFIHALLAIPAVAAAAKLLPLISLSPVMVSKPVVATLRAGTYAQYRAAAGIRKGSLVRFYQLGDLEVVPSDGGMGGWFAGVAMHDAMEGDMIRVMTDGTAAVNLKSSDEIHVSVKVDDPSTLANLDDSGDFNRNYYSTFSPRNYYR